MKYAFVSDIHANLHALTRVIDDIKARNVDIIICLGDIIGYGPKPQETVDCIRKECRYFILGNHDAVVAGYMSADSFNTAAQRAIQWTKTQLNEETITFLKSLSLELAGEDFACSHGEFLVPGRYGYIFTPEDALASFASTDKRLLFTGHSHVPLYFKMPQKEMPSQHPPETIHLEPATRYIINVGSVGQPRDRDLRACYCVYDVDAQTIEYVRLAYDIDRTRSELICAGVPLPPAIFRTIENSDFNSTPPSFHSTDDQESPVLAPIPIPDSEGDKIFSVEEDFTPLQTAISSLARRREFIQATKKQSRMSHSLISMLILLVALIAGIALYAYFALSKPQTEPPETAVNPPPVDSEVTHIGAPIRGTQHIRVENLDTEPTSPALDSSVTHPKPIQTPANPYRLEVPVPMKNTSLRGLGPKPFSLSFRTLQDDPKRDFGYILLDKRLQDLKYLEKTNALKIENARPDSLIQMTSRATFDVPKQKMEVKLQGLFLKLDSGSVKIAFIDGKKNKCIREVDLAVWARESANLTFDSACVIEKEEIPEMLAVEIRVTAKCTLSLQELQFTYPKEKITQYALPDALLRLCPPPASSLKNTYLQSQAPIKAKTLSFPGRDSSLWNLNADTPIEFIFAKEKLAFKSLNGESQMECFSSPIEITNPAAVQLRLALEGTLKKYTGNLKIQLLLRDTTGQYWIADEFRAHDLDEKRVKRLQINLKNLPAPLQKATYMIRILGKIKGEVSFSTFDLECL